MKAFLPDMTLTYPGAMNRLAFLAPIALAVAAAGPLAPAASATDAPVVASAPAKKKQQSQLYAAFTLMAPKSVAQSQLVARAIISGGGCPALKVTKPSGKVSSLPMSVRPRPGNTGNYFADVVVCTRQLPSVAATATIWGRTVPAKMPANIDRMALFADTGCRIAEFGTTYDVQKCNQPSTGWPLNQIARSIAADKPDVILNPGDYYYREVSCPVQFSWAKSACGGSPDAPSAGFPFTDTAAGWRADVFTPMAPLFPVAPIAMLRGNHEACFRAGNGFFYFLDPRPGTSGLCSPVSSQGKLHPAANATTPTWSVDLDLIKGRTLRVAMVDSAYGNDASVTPWAATQRPTYQAAATLTKPGANQEAWLMTHRPVIGHNSAWISADQTAASVGLLGTYNLVLSSHIHIVQGIKIPGLPPSLVMGNGGTALDRKPGPMTTPLSTGGTTFPMATTDWSAAKWGYALATAGSANGRWTIRQKSQSGSTFATCQLNNRAMTCS